MHVLLTLILVLLSPLSYATSGRTNSDGCHKSKKVGYHCHGNSKSLSTSYSIQTKQPTSKPANNIEHLSGVSNPPDNHNLVFIIQTYLNKLGYYKGSISGDFDLNTKTAIEKYQSEKKLAVDGQPSNELIGDLIREISAQ
ncbi:peptidoglycan-binding protein [Pseudoalteromonas sp. JBTF-M23]|uniref:Peptidoglycan-binding protein n=1 Tax=Pseudoalteromonas caenipelagi TaxID=2726988 RepID=A0A849V9K4_9GAMM|nr:peptidoglycan-binding protein [Pseudoalteromonas caenipelagi]